MMVSAFSGKYHKRIQLLILVGGWLEGDRWCLERYLHNFQTSFRLAAYVVPSLKEEVCHV